MKMTDMKNLIEHTAALDNRAHVEIKNRIIEGVILGIVTIAEAVVIEMEMAIEAFMIVVRVVTITDLMCVIGVLTTPRLDMS